jgi:hypothetical protein
MIRSLLSRFRYSMRGRNLLSLRALPFSSPSPGGSILLYLGLVFPVRCSPSVNMSRVSYVLYFTGLLVKVRHVDQVASSVYVTLISPLRIECQSVLSPARSAPSSHTSTATTTISYVRTISHTPGRRWHAFPPGRHPRSNRFKCGFSLPRFLDCPQRWVMGILLLPLSGPSTVKPRPLCHSLFLVLCAAAPCTRCTRA